jgi:hypothetical protein
LASNAAPSIVGGLEFSGMSKNAVKPPAASAAVPVSSPSQCVRPGSLKCTWGSRPAGKTCRPVASSSVFAPSSSGPIPAIAPSMTPTSASIGPDGVTTVPPRTTKS